MLTNPSINTFSINNEKNKHNSVACGTTAQKTKPHDETTVIFKTLCVRISRDSELIKKTVQKALLANLTKKIGVLPSATHMEPDRSSANSTDSLQLEFCHFKPIKTTPTTPTDRYCGQLNIPKVKQACEQQHTSSKKNIVSPKLSAIFFTPSKRSAFCYIGSVSVSETVKNSTQSSRIQNKRARVRVKRCQEPTSSSKTLRNCDKLSSKTKKECIPNTKPSGVITRSRNKNNCNIVASKKLQQMKKSQVLNTQKLDLISRPVTRAFLRSITLSSRLNKSPSSSVLNK